MRTRAARFGGLVCALHGNQAPITGGKSAVLHAFSRMVVNFYGCRALAREVATTDRRRLVPTPELT